MRRTRILAIVVSFCACLVLVAPLCGCGSKKKKPGATVAERIKKAKADKTPGGPARELVKVARSQFKNGDRSGAIKTLAEAKAAVPEDADAVIFAPRLVDVAGLYAELAERKPAKEALDAATQLAKRLEDPVTRAQTLARIGVVYGAKTGGLGDTATAKKRLEEASAAAGEVPERFQAQALAAVALGYANAGVAEAAKKMLADLEAKARALEEPRPKAEALAAAANVRARNGEKLDAVSLLEEAAKVAKGIDSHANRTYALLAVASAMKAAGENGSAADLIKLADKAANSISDPEQQKEAVREVRAAQNAAKS